MATERNEPDSKDKLLSSASSKARGPRCLHQGQGGQQATVVREGASQGGQVLKDPKRDQNLLACLGREQDQNRQWNIACLGLGFWSRSRKAQHQSMGAWAQVASCSCSLQQAASIGPLEKQCRYGVGGFEVLKKLAGDVNGGPSPSCACPCMYSK